MSIDGKPVDSKARVSQPALRSRGYLAQEDAGWDEATATPSSATTLEEQRNLLALGAPTTAHDSGMLCSRVLVMINYSRNAFTANRPGRSSTWRSSKT